MANKNMAQLQPLRVNYNPRNVDLSNFTVLASCSKDKAEYFRYDDIKNDDVVYVLQFGEDLYVGSSGNIYVRIQQHFQALKNGKCSNSRMQEAFNRSGWFKAYLIMRCEKNGMIAEHIIIQLLQPSLNITLPKGNRKFHDNIVWVPKHSELIAKG